MKKGEAEGHSPGDVTAMIYFYVKEKIPFLDRKTYGIIVLVFSMVIMGYGIYSNISTDKILSKEVVPGLKKNSDKLHEILDDNERAAIYSIIDGLVSKKKLKDALNDVIKKVA